MLKHIAAIIGVFCLSGCTPPLAPSAYAPANPEFYKELPPSFYLQHKIAIGLVTNSYKADDIVTGENYAKALRGIYGSSHMLAGSDDILQKHAPLVENTRARYKLGADIIDYQYTQVGFTHITVGAAVTYALTDNTTGQEVFRKTITATMDSKKTIFDDVASVMTHTLGIALGENAAQSVREFAALGENDFEQHAPHKTKRGNKK